MRIATLNLWHGLAPGIGSTFHSLEPKFRREQRESLQRDWLKNLGADIILLQEANPAKQRCENLKGLLKFDGFYQGDLTGIKIGSIGWPHNLNTGLVTLLRSSFNARDLGGVKLSGASGWAGKWSSWQLTESRYALLSEFAHRDWGRGLVVNVHMHHGLEFDLSLREKVQKLLADGSITPTAFGELRSRLESGDLRRDEELEVLLHKLENLKNRYAFILLGGDLNCSPFGAVYQRLKKSGFSDLWVAAGKSETGGETFDSNRNSASHRFTSQYPMTVQSEDLSFSPKVRDGLKQLLQEHESRPRRIDYLWAITGGDRGLKIFSAEVQGVPQPDGLSLSDHFAVVVDLE